MQFKQIDLNYFQAMILKAFFKVFTDHPKCLFCARPECVTEESYNMTKVVITEFKLPKKREKGPKNQG